MTVRGRLSHGTSDPDQARQWKPTGRNRHRARRWRVGLCLVVSTVQLLIVVSTLSLLVQLRDWAIEEMATPRGRQQWNAWRDAVRREADGNGPVHRRVPSSDEPPIVILLRDHFAASAAGVTIFLSMIVWLTIGALWGSWRRGRHRAAPGKVVTRCGNASG